MVNGNQQLPDGWVFSTLGKVATAQSGAGFPKTFQGQTSGDYPLAKVSDITESVKFNGGVIAKANNYLSADEAKKLGAKVFPEGTTLFAKIGEALRLNRRALSSLSILADNNVMGLIPDRDQVLSKYLYYFMQTVDLSEYSQATTVPSVRKSDIENIEFPLPPLPEQERIVAKIEELFTQLEAGTSALERVQAGLRRYKASVLKAAVEGRLVGADGIRPSGQTPSARTGELPEGWRWTTVGESADHRLGKMLDKEKNRGNLRPYLRNINVRWFKFDFSDIQEMRVLDEELENISVQRGDLIVCEGGEPGRAAVWNKDETMVIQKALHRVRTKEFVLPSYLMYCLAADANNGRLEKYFTGSTIKHFTGQSLKAYAFPLPSLEEQRRIVAEVERRLSVARQVESSVEAALVRASRLRQAVLRSAFDGRLA